METAARLTPSLVTVKTHVSRPACGADSFNWAEYDENNNGLTLTYQVGYLA